MKKKFAKNSLIITTCAFIIGLVLIFSSLSIGQSRGHNAIQANGGSMDTWQYELIITSNTENFRTVGLVLSLVGGLGALLSGYALYNKLDN